MLIPYFPQVVPAHETALVNISVYSDDTPFSGILPHGDVAVVGQDRFFLSVHCYHYLIFVNLATQVLVVEVSAGV